MTLLEFIISVSGVIFVFLTIDAFQRKKITLLHALIFCIGIGLILYFSFDYASLNAFGSFFGVARGADLLVYSAIILLGYLYFELLNRITKTATNFTKLVSFEAISSLKKNVDIKEKIRQYQNKSFKDEFVFLVRAYNEAQMIGQVIDDIIKAGYHKIVVVSDGSIDETDSIVLAKREYYSDSLIFLLNHQVNRGGGAANKTGFEFLKRYGEYLAPWVVTFDADGQMDVADMLSFESEIKNAPKPLDILLGSRYVKGGSAQNIPTLRKIIHVGSKGVTYFFSRIRVSDPHNGYRVISLQTVKKMNIVSDNMTYASELLDEISRLHLKYVEVPVNIIYTDYSLSKGQKNANALKILLEMIYTKFFYK